MGAGRGYRRFEGCIFMGKEDVERSGRCCRQGVAGLHSEDGGAGAKTEKGGSAGRGGLEKQDGNSRWEVTSGCRIWQPQPRDW